MRPFTNLPSIAIYRQLPCDDAPFIGKIIRAAGSCGLMVEMTHELLLALTAAGINPLEDDTVIHTGDTPTDRCRMVLSLGGDGTFLRAARRTLQGSCAPVAGINTGTLGFLAAWEREDFRNLLEMAASYRIPVRERTLIELHGSELPADAWPLALNDIAILRSQSSQMITVSASLNGSPLTNYTGDGLILCTATGSTAYNLSAGGPVLQPDTDALVLTPIAPHTLTQRPLVAAADSRLRLRVTGRADNFLVSIDGVSYTLPIGSTLEIARASRRLRIVHNAAEDFAARLRSKLMWGENPVPR